MVEPFLLDLDTAWASQRAGVATLKIIGSTALFLQTDYRRGTKDSDVLETATLTEAVQRRLLSVGGRGSDLHRKHRLYLEIVGGSFPFLAEEPVWRPLADLNERLASLRVEVLDVVDVVVAKLARMHSTDREDITAMADRDLIRHAALLDRFQSAVQRVWHDARADDLPRIVRGLNWIERDLLDVPETEIELPSWVDD